MILWILLGCLECAGVVFLCSRFHETFFSLLAYCKWAETNSYVLHVEQLERNPKLTIHHKSRPVGCELDRVTIAVAMYTPVNSTIIYQNVFNG